MKTTLKKQFPSSPLPQALSDEVSALSAAALSEATKRAYRGHCRAFSRWCAELNVPSFPTTPECVAGWVAYLVRCHKKPSTISQSVSAISSVHVLQGGSSLRHTPHVKKALNGARRILGVAPQQKKAATAQLVLKMIESMTENTLKDKRDRAILALGFAGAFRRSELVALKVSDIENTPGGALITIGKSKTDQVGEGQIIGIPEGNAIKPLAHLREWIKEASITEGLIFRRINRHGHLLGALSGDFVALLVKKAAQHIGCDPQEFSGHSLRAGFITSGAEAGKDAIRIAEVSRHKNLNVLKGYIRRANLLKDHAGSSFL